MAKHASDLLAPLGVTRCLCAPKAAIYGGVTPDADRLNGGVGGMVGDICCKMILDFQDFEIRFWTATMR